MAEGIVETGSGRRGKGMEWIPDWSVRLQSLSKNDMVYTRYRQIRRKIWMIFRLSCLKNRICDPVFHLDISCLFY